MNKNRFKSAAILIIIPIIISIITSNIAPAVVSAMTPPIASTIDTADRQNILNATIRITMLFPVPPATSQEGDSNGQQSTRFTAAVGMGTKVTYQGEQMIITHDHWKYPLSKLALVEFRNARNDLLLELDGPTFSNLVRHQDGGTMIFNTPEGLRNNQDSGANIDLSGLVAARQVQAGDVVAVVRQQPGNENQATVLKAVVESIGQEQGNTTFNLRSLDGQAIVHGDSGGGVFLNGQLVGNLWSTDLIAGRRILGLFTIKSDKQTTDKSTAARLPIEALSSS